MFLVESLIALFMVASFVAGMALLIADYQARKEPVHQESGAWRRPRR